MSEGKLTQEELSEEIEKCDYELCLSRRAYNQLKEIVGEHFSDSTGYDSLLTKAASNIREQRKLLNKQSEQITKLLIQQKPTVTREWVSRMALDISTRTYFDSSDHKQGKTPLFYPIHLAEYPEVERAIIKWLDELGVGMVK